jgi:PIN domain nuclease of toxin-antitoxin system
MTLLLDAHAFLWFCQGDPKLSATAKTVIEDPGNRKMLSVASCWETAIKAGLGKLRLGEPSSTYIPAALSRTGIELLPITLAHATSVEALPAHHRDPFDRLLTAQALADGLAVVSNDPLLDPYGITRIGDQPFHAGREPCGDRPRFSLV